MPVVRTVLIYSIIVVVAVLFVIKTKVQKLNNELIDIELKINAEKENIHILKAELAYISKPQQIEKLASQYLHLKVMEPDQIVNIELTPEELAKIQSRGSQ